MTDKILSMIKKEYRVRSLNAGVFHKLVIQGMNFAIDIYEAVGLGRVAVMRASGLLGLMRRDTLIVSPLEKAAPLVSYERIKVFGKETYILTKYDLKNPAVRVEKEGKKKQATEFDLEIETYINSYLEEAKLAEECKPSSRKKDVKVLVDQLIQDQKLSADIFLANYGVDVAEKLYHEVMFGTK